MNVATKQSQQQEQSLTYHVQKEVDLTVINRKYVSSFAYKCTIISVILLDLCLAILLAGSLNWLFYFVALSITSIAVGGYACFNRDSSLLAAAFPALLLLLYESAFGLNLEYYLVVPLIFARSLLGITTHKLFKNKILLPDVAMLEDGYINIATGTDIVAINANKNLKNKLLRGCNHFSGVILFYQPNNETWVVARNSYTSNSQRFIKHMFDRLFALLMIIVLSPLLLFITLLVKMTSKGSPIYQQWRGGQYGKRIKVWKFRTMYSNLSDDGEVTVKQAQASDQRVTKVGKFLRKSSLDELPQLFNVLLGDMSIVGPRPHALAHDKYYANIIPHYKLRQRMKPGLTGLAQAKGFRGETKTIELMEQRIAKDIFYTENYRLWLDIKIILMTVKELIVGSAH
jgi:lipopolysaccharide/colanic/teichoic acid biosynthesis glycosyltransferase